ncbi:hypothetical protein PGC34_01035 [Pseudomonas kribbensis]|uniref:hypothetical protein n=1 Tax=Pseudomonas kribbensis TaxID=1628086 RepID=UPI00273A3020|nr:hypothetical protein [Pseudomonas sp. A29(2023)]MDL5592929.1 hypothetical protein [Bacillus subtilis]
MNSNVTSGVDHTKLTENLSVEPPVVNLPNGDVKNPVNFSGTGLPGWMVVVVSVPFDGTDLASAFVQADGSWSTDVQLSERSFSAVAFQTNNRERSPFTAIFDFKVVSG